MSVVEGGASSLLSVDITLNQSELFRSECRRLILESDRGCKRLQDEDNKQLCQRLQDIQFVQKELEGKLEELLLETDALRALQDRVVKALQATREPLRVTMLCLEERTKRVPSVRLEDDVHAELRKERRVMDGVAALLQQVVEQIKEQIRLNRSAEYHLKKDLKEKFEAQSIDKSCATMTTHSLSNLPSQSRHAPQPTLSVTPEQWENLSEVNMAQAEQQERNSGSLRALVESVLEQTAADMQKQLQATTAAIHINVQDIKSAKSQMEDKLPKVQSEILGLQKMREDLLAAISENEHCLSATQAKLALRHQRPGKEQCNDPVQFQLRAHLQKLNTHIQKLREEVSQSEVEERALVACQRTLQEDIDIQANSLYVDEVLCIQHREPVFIQKF